MEQNFTPNFEIPQYFRVLMKIDFNVPHNAVRVPALWGADASQRYDVAKKFSPHWLSSTSSHFLTKLDRLVLLDRDVEVPGVESVIVHVAIPHHQGERKWCTVNLTFENSEEFVLITSFDVDTKPNQEFVTLGQEYQKKYPTAKTAMALKRIV